MISSFYNQKPNSACHKLFPTAVIPLQQIVTITLACNHYSEYKATSIKTFTCFNILKLKLLLGYILINACMCICIVLCTNLYSVCNIHAYKDTSYVCVMYDWVNKPLIFLMHFISILKQETPILLIIDSHLRDIIFNMQ